MITVDVAPSSVVDTLNAMYKKIAHIKAVELGQTLSDWQTQDMHRNKPFTMRSCCAGKASTVIRPHSLFEVKRSQRYQSGMARCIKRGSKTKKALLILLHYEPRTSTRAILREFTEALLRARLSALLDELKW